MALRAAKGDESRGGRIWLARTSVRSADTLVGGAPPSAPTTFNGAPVLIATNSHGGSTRLRKMAQLVLLAFLATLAAALLIWLGVVYLSRLPGARLAMLLLPVAAGTGRFCSGRRRFSR